MPGAADILVHLTPCPVIVTVREQDFTIPAVDALGWLRLLLAKPIDLYGIFPILAGSDAIEAVEDALWDEQLTEYDVAVLALEAVAVAADRPWWVVTRLLGSVAPHWSVLHVNNAAGMSLAGWLDELWSKTIANMDPKHRASWEHQIDTPPKGWESAVDFNEEEKAFMAAMRSAQ